jgi:hypothetical protein
MKKLIPKLELLLQSLFRQQHHCPHCGSSKLEMIEKTRWLLDHPDERKCLSLSAHQHIIRGSNTYSDRLHYILNTLSQ